MPRTVVLKSGKVITDVPDDWTDEEVERRWKAKQERESEEESREARREGPRPGVDNRGSTDAPDTRISDDVPQVPQSDPYEGVNVDRSQGAPIITNDDPVPGGSSPRNLEEEGDIIQGIDKYYIQPAQSVLRATQHVSQEAARSVQGELIAPVANTAVGALAAIDPFYDAEEYRKSARDVLNTLSPGRPYFVDDQGQLRSEEAESLVAKVAPYVLVGAPLYAGAKAVVGGTGLFNTAVSTLLAGQATEQLLTDPFEDNIFNAIDSLVDPERQSLILDYLASDEDDTELEGRVKLAFQDATFTGALMAIPGMTHLLSKVGDATIGKLIKNPRHTITDEEAGDVILKLIKDIKRPLRNSIANPGKRAPIQEGLETTGGMAQVVRQAQEPGVSTARKWAFNATRWMPNLRSRGYFTEDGFKLFQAAESSRRALLQRVENMSIKLNHLTKEFVQEGGDVATINAALTAKDQAARTAALRSLPKNLRDQVKLARNTIDRMSREILDSPALTNDLRESIEGNVGRYLTRSFRAYEDARWVPHQSLRDEAGNELAQTILKSRSKEYIKIKDFETARRAADDVLNSMLDRNGAKSWIEFNDRNMRINQGIFRRKKDLPESIRKFLGEITDPADNIVMTAEKMSDIVYKGRMFEGLEKLGYGKWLHTGRPSGIFNTKIEGTNSVLDGYYTTEGMFKALTGVQGTLGKVTDNWLVRNFGMLKGTVQSMKTVYSHPTHLKNMIGGFMFRTANGYAPFSRHSKTAFRTIANRLKNEGDEVLDDIYQEALELGIINTNTKVGEFRSLIQDGIDKPNQLSERIVSLIGKVTPDKHSVLGRLPEKVYMGTDDYFKINTYFDYFETLKKAFPEVPEANLKRQAAEVTRNIIPNYDLVPPAFKELRKLPLGNFVGFSTEVARTSFNIIKLASKEIGSGNQVLMDRGLKRLVGITATTVGGGLGITQLSQHLLGLGPEETRAANVFMERPWSKNVNAVYARDEEGEVYGLDLSTINPYNYVFKPAQDIINAYYAGEAQNLEATEIIENAMKDAATTILSPFTVSIATEEVSQAANGLFALWNDGVGVDGERVEEPWEIITEVLKGFEPGSLTAARRLGESIVGTPQGFSGEPRDVDTELTANFTGMRWSKIKPIESLNFAISDFNTAMEETTQVMVGYAETPQDILQNFRKLNGQAWRHQAKLYRYIKGAQAWGADSAEIFRTLTDRGISEDMATALWQGRFTPPRDAKGIVDSYREGFENVYRQDRGEFTMTRSQLLTQMSRDYSAMYGISLEELVPDEEIDGKEPGVEILRQGRR